ncbi:MAG: hypothetical protein BYD32DRAFT_433238 [Podila humilis]|nr:MAG: hypothetical protein BYD32DRAFT_433238 [Podila humilis]
MTKPQFDFIVNLIKNHSVFEKRWRKPQAHVEIQLKPTLEEKEVIKKQLGKGNLNNVIGAVDDATIPIHRAPAFGRDSFATRRSKFALVQLGFVTTEECLFSSPQATLSADRAQCMGDWGSSKQSLEGTLNHRIRVVLAIAGAKQVAVGSSTWSSGGDIPGATISKQNQIIVY